MIVLDTHIWVWWVHGDEKLTATQLEVIAANEDGEIGISAISLWEIAKLVENKRLELPVSVELSWGSNHRVDSRNRNRIDPPAWGISQRPR